MRSIFIIACLATGAAFAADTAVQDICRRTNAVSGDSLDFAEQTALNRLGVSSQRQAYTLDGAAYAKIEPSETTELGRAAREMQQLGLSLAVSQAWHRKGGKNPYNEQLGVLVLPDSALSTGKIDSGTRQKIEALKTEHTQLLEQGARLLNEYGVRHREVEVEGQGKLLEVFPDNETALGRFAKEMNEIGVPVHIDGLGLERGQGLAVYLTDKKSISLSVWVLQHGKGEPGVVAEHEADHARREALQAKGVDSLFHGQVTPPRGQSFDQLPPNYRRGFSIDEARGHVKAGVGFTREWLAKRKAGKLDTAAEESLINFTLGTLEDGRVLSSFTAHLGKSTLGGLNGETTKPPQVETGRGNWLKGLFMKPAVTEAPRLLVDSLVLGGPKGTSPREIAVGITDHGVFSYSHMDSSVPLPAKSPFSYGGRLPQPDEGPFLQSLSARAKKLADVHSAYERNTMILEVAIKRARHEKFSAASLAKVEEAARALDDSVLPLTTSPN